MEIKSDISILRTLKEDISEYFKTTHLKKEVRSSDIYGFIKTKQPYKSKFLNGKEFNGFLRKMHKKGVLKQIISNISVDIANPKYYKWYFHRDDITNNKDCEVKATIKNSSSKNFKNKRIILTNSSQLVRSKQEQYIYNKLINNEELIVYYERNLQKKIPDFTIVNKNTKLVFHWEHFGFEDNLTYLQKVEDKLNWYKEKGYDFIQNGGRLIFTFFKTEESFKIDVEKNIQLILNQ